MFPPGNASVRVAVAEHLDYRRSWFADLVGPLLVASSRWAEFADACAGAGSPTLDVVVIGADRAPVDVPTGVRLCGFEVPVIRLPLPAPLDGHRHVYEITAVDDKRAVLEAVAKRRAGGDDVVAKYRTGGTTADDFPAEEQVAVVIRAAVATGAPLKFTAGLHAAVRFTDAPTGFEHHGFLNLMLAVAAASRGAGDAVLIAALAERDAAKVADQVSAWSADQERTVRETFVSFGCCGVKDPVGDLVKLGLLTSEES